MRFYLLDKLFATPFADYSILLVRFVFLSIKVGPEIFCVRYVPTGKKDTARGATIRLELDWYTTEFMPLYLVGLTKALPLHAQSML